MRVRGEVERAKDAKNERVNDENERMERVEREKYETFQNRSEVDLQAAKEVRERLSGKEQRKGIAGGIRMA